MGMHERCSEYEDEARKEAKLSAEKVARYLAYHLNDEWSAREDMERIIEKLEGA